MRFFKLICLEASFLRRTIFLIGLILMAFVAALLSVISVLLDVPEGMYSGLDDYMSNFTLTVNDVSPAFSNACGGDPFYGTETGLTHHAVITGKKGSFATDPPTVSKDDLPQEGEKEEEKQEIEVRVVRNGYAVPSASAEKAFAPYANLLLGANPAWPAKPGEICLDKDFAQLIGVKIGETVTVAPDKTYCEDYPELETMGARTFTVTGLYSRTQVANSYSLSFLVNSLPGAYFYCVPEEDMTFSSLTFLYTDARSLHAAYFDLIHDGYTAKMNSTAARQFENISLAQAFFGAVSGVLGAMVLFIVYSLIAIFYRQRKAQICRLKLLGATDGTVAAVYCVIAVFLVAVAVAVGAAFSMLFNLYFMNLCGQLFNKFSSNFVSHFRPIVPIAVFLALALFTLILFRLFIRKIKKTAVAQEVRHE